jgi:antitoxin component YwqK of YwqJK toxin-antitoxin module
MRLPDLDMSRVHMVSASFYAPDGSFASQIRNGSGTASYYHENGTLAKLEAYADDMNYLCMLWDREGRLWYYTRHTPGNTADFVALAWYPDGQRKSEERMTGGQGVRRHWSAEGDLEFVHRSLAASLALYEWYDKGGNLARRDRCENDCVVSREYFDGNGNASRRLTAEEAKAEDERAAAAAVGKSLTGLDKLLGSPTAEAEVATPESRARTGQDAATDPAQSGAAQP